MSIINIVAAIQVTEALKLLTGQRSALHGSLMQFDVWQNQWREINPGNRRVDCETCGLGRYETLSATPSESAAILCGRDAIQISPQRQSVIDFEALAERLRGAGEVKFNQYLLRFTTGDFELTVFRDARSIVRGTNEIAIARSLYAKYIGN
jgi:molybdopterin-synthase adenylyltransferase